MEWKIDDRFPIWSQLTEQLEAYISSGGFKPGEKLPSVRDFASEAGVNPNTMQRALSELEGRGLIVTNRTAGRTVTEDADRIKSVRQGILRRRIEDFLDSIEELGIKDSELESLLRKAISERSGGTVG